MPSLTFSIVVPLYNKADYVERALASIYAQTCAPSEIIVVDDLSTDNSFYIAEKYLTEKQQQRPDIQVKLIRSSRNRGPGGARNLGLEQVTSDLVLFLDADDEYQPELLSNIESLAVNKGAKVVIFGYQRQPENRVMPKQVKPTGTGDSSCQLSLPQWLGPYRKGACKLEQPLGFVDDRRYPVGPGSNVAAHTDIINHIRYDESANVYEGIDFWFRVIRNAAQQDAQVYYLLRPHHIVHSVPKSLIRKTLSLRDVEQPRVLRRYQNSSDNYEIALHDRVANVWFKNTLSRLAKMSDKLHFAWRYKRYLRVALSRR